MGRPRAGYRRRPAGRTLPGERSPRTSRIAQRAEALNGAHVASARVGELERDRVCPGAGRATGTGKLRSAAVRARAERPRRRDEVALARDEQLWVSGGRRPCPQHGGEHVVEELRVEDAAHRAAAGSFTADGCGDGRDAVHGLQVVEPGDAVRGQRQAVRPRPRIGMGHVQVTWRAGAVAQHHPSRGRRPSSTVGSAGQQQDPIVVIPAGGDQVPVAASAYGAGRACARSAGGRRRTRPGRRSRRWAVGRTPSEISRSVSVRGPGSRYAWTRASTARAAALRISCSSTSSLCLAPIGTSVRARGARDAQQHRLQVTRRESRCADGRATVAAAGAAPRGGRRVSGCQAPSAA